MSLPASLGPYPIERELGRGGMGVVYLGRDPKLDRPVAIKVVPAALAQNPDTLARFEREARLLASVNHPNIAAIYAVEEASDGQRLLVMEYVPGDTLADRLALGPLPVDAALDVCRQIAAGIEAAHEAGIVHRDLKPGNVKVLPDDSVKVLDFGLAKGGAASSADLAQSPTLTYSPTAIGVILGTAGYMSPEQARGKPVDRRTDVWALGCVLFECLTGRKVFEGETVSDTIARILEREPDWNALPAATPPRVRELLRRCLEKDMKRRQRDVGDLRLELEEALALRSSTMRAAIPSGVDAAAAAPAPSRGKRLALAAALVIAGAAAGIGLWSFLGPRGAAPSSPISLSITVPESIRPVQARLLQRSPVVLVRGHERRPDGSEDPVARLYRRSLTSFDLVPLGGSEGVVAFTMSPDEQWILMHKPVRPGATDRRLVKMPTDGTSPPIELTDWDPEWEGFVWLYDGDILIHASQGTKLLRLSSNGGSPGAAFPLELEGGATGFPTFEEDLPDGRGVLMVIATWGPRGYREDIWLLDPKTGKGRRLIENGSNVEYQAETGYLLFSRQSSLMAVRFDLASQTVQGDLIALFDGLRSAAWSNGGFRISHAGHLMFQPGGRLTGDRRLVVVSPTREVNAFVSDARAYEADLDASSDGNRVAVVVPTPGGTYETWTATAGRPGVRRTLAVPNADAAGSAWSPDGQWLAFVRLGRDADDGIYLQGSDGGGSPRALVRFTAADEFMWVSGWTADGTGLLVNRATAGRADIMLLPISTDGTAGQLRPLRATPASEFDARISADGRLIAFGSDESGTNELYVAEFANNAIVGSPLLVTGGNGGGHPRWSSDSRRLFFLRTVPDRIMSLTVERTPALRATEPSLAFDPVSLRLDQNVWTILPGDRLLGVELSAGEGPVRSYQLILNWLDTVRDRLPR